MSVRIIVDSTADLTPAVKARLTQVPLTVHFGEEDYIDGVTITHKEFYEKLVECDTLPTTSQATPFAFSEVFQQTLDAGEDAVVITQSGSVQEALYKQYVNGACKEFKLVANMTDAYLAVSEGKADVCICSIASADLYAEANGGLTTPDFLFEVDPSMNGTCVAMPMDGTESLAQVVNECIAELNAEGKIEAWNEEYKAMATSLGIE